HGRLLHERDAPRGPDEEVAGGVDAHGTGALDFDVDGGRVGARGDGEVALQPAAVGAVPPEVDAVVDVREAGGGVVGDVGVPLRRVVADEVVGPGLEQAVAGGGGRGVGAGEVEADDVADPVGGVGARLQGAGQDEDGVGGGQEGREAGAADEEANGRVGLAD